jgi:O-antigen/teichoic acid export membrane protein
VIGALLRKLRGGGELKGFAGDSMYVGFWQAAIALADLAQIALITGTLGLHDYGRLALTMGFVVLVGQFFDVRVGAAATTFGARMLRTDSRRAAGIVQMSYLIDLSTGVVGFVVVAALAPVVGPGLIGHGGTTLILLYALTLLVSTVDESAITVLRLLDRFRLIATYTIPIEVVRIGLVAGALAAFHSLPAVLIALVVYQALTGLINVIAATSVFRRATGERVTKPALELVRDQRRGMLRMIFHTNVVSYARIAQVQLPTLVVGTIAGATEVGLYKVGMAAAAAVGRIADPAYVALLPRLSRLWAAGRREDVRRLIERASLVSVPAMAVAVTGLILLRSPILELLGGGRSALGAGTVVVLAGLAQAVNGALFWNQGLLFVTERSRLVARLALLGMAIQLTLLVPLVEAWGANGAAVSFIASMTITNVAAAWLGLRELSRAAPRAGPEEGEAVAIAEELAAARGGS